MHPKSYPQVTQFDPGEKALVMHLDPHCCYKQRTGVCSLDLEEGEVPEERSVRVSNSSTARYCRDLYKSFLEKGIQNPVRISESGCGHYDIADVQHRLCIAKKTGQIMPAYLGKGYDECNLCVRVKDGVFDMIKDLFARVSRADGYFLLK